MSISAMNAERLVGLRVQIGGDPLALGDHVGVRAEDFELSCVRRLDPLVAHVDGGQRVNALGRAVLERQVARLVEQDVHDHALGGREDDVLDELLVLDVAAVAADELHARARQRDLERPRVRGVREVEADDLAEPRVQRQVRLAVDQQHLAEAPHRHIGRLRAAERRDLPVLEQDVVERQRQVPVGGRPVVRVGRLDEQLPYRPSSWP